MSTLWRFPILAVDELADLCSSMDIKFTAEQIREANAKDVRQVYEIMVENCMGITTQDMQIPFYVLNKLEHPELHERSYPVQALFRHLSKLTKVCGVRDFNVTDITSPDPKRTLFILSAIMNFEKFRVDRLTHFASYQDEADALAEARDQSGERLNLVSKRMESVRAQVEAEAPVASELMTSINTLESTVASLKERQKQLRDSHAAAVAGRTQALAQAAASSESRQRLSTECTQLRARIVPSPEEMRRLLVELSHTIESLKKENLSSNVACRETQAKSELLDKISGSLGKRIATMEELAADLARIRKLSKDIKDHNDNAAQAASTVKEIEAHSEHLKEQINELFEKTTKQKKQFEYKKRRAAMALEDVQAQRAQLAREQEQERRRLAVLETQVSKKQGEITELKDAHDRVILTLKSRMEALSFAVQQYHLDLAEAMKA